ncbi:MAG: hypothetical protein HOO87_18070 [Methyloglobulus sp.]|nr:hypothetical protein [Methyloglobulus sp.]
MPRQRFKLETPIKPISYGGEVAMGVFAKLKGMASPAKTGFHVAEQGVGPAEFGQALGFSPTNRQQFMSATGFDAPPEKQAKPSESTVQLALRWAFDHAAIALWVNCSGQIISDTSIGSFAANCCS